METTPTIQKWINTSEVNYNHFLKWFIATYPKHKKITKGDTTVYRRHLHKVCESDGETHTVNKKYFVPFIRDHGYTIRS